MGMCKRHFTNPNLGLLSQIKQFFGGFATLYFENLNTKKIIQTCGDCRKAAGIPDDESTPSTNTTQHWDEYQVLLSYYKHTHITCLTSTQTTTDLERVFTLSHGQNTPRVGSLGGRIPVNKRWIDIGADVDNRFQHSCCFALLAYFAILFFK